MNTIVVWAGVLGSVLGIFTSVIGIIALYRGAIRKGYAAERDFQHLKEDLKNLSRNIDYLFKDLEQQVSQNRGDLDNRCDRIDKDTTEIKALLLANLRLKNSLREDD